MLVAVSVLVIAWLGLGLRSLDLREEGEWALERAQGGSLPAGDREEAIRSLRAARRFGADGELLLLEGTLLFSSGRRREAAIVSRRLIEAEPMNDRAWFLSYLTAADGRRAGLRERVAELNPWAADALR